MDLGGAFRYSTGCGEIEEGLSRMEAGTSGVLSISDSGRRLPAEYGPEIHASSSVEEWISACLSSYSRSDRPLVELCVEPAGFSGRCTGMSVPLRVVPSSKVEKAEEPEIKLPTSAGSSKKQENSRKHLFLLF